MTDPDAAGTAGEGQGPSRAADAPRPLVATGAPRAGSSARGGGRRSRTAPPMTIAERRRAERRRQEEDQ